MKWFILTHLLFSGEEEKQARSKKAKNSIDDGKNVQNKAQVINDLSSQNIDSTSGQTITTDPEHSFWPASPVKQTVLLKTNHPEDCHQERPYFNSTGRSSTHSQHLRFETPADGRHWVQEPSSEDTVNAQAFETGHSVGFNTSLASAPPMSDASTHGNNPLSSFLGKPQPTVSALSSHIHALHQHVIGESQLSKPTTLSSLPPSTSFPLPNHSDFQHIARDQIPSDPFMFWRLTEEERSLLAHLSSVYQDTVLSILQMNPPKESVPLHLMTKELCIEEHEGLIRSVISFVKYLQDFRQLGIDDQIALVKASNDPVLSLRACALYISEKEAWLCNYGYITQEHQRHIYPDNPFIDQFLQFCSTVKKIVKNDTTLYALLHCVILFDPNDERITDRQSVNMIRGKFLTLLRHYLESVYSYCHSDRYMLVLQELILYLRDLCHESRYLMKKIFPKISNELLVELYDLDQ